MFRIVGMAAVMLAMAQSLQAVPISGAIGFQGGVRYNKSSVTDATAVTAWVAPTISLPPTGSFSSILPGAGVTFSSSTWNFKTTSPISSFWSVGGFTFELLASSVTSQGPGFVVVNGTGIVSAIGYSPTPMSWSFTAQDQQFGTRPGTWMFAVLAHTVQPSSVPDGGGTLVLLGLGLSVLAVMRKRLMA